MFTSSDRGTAMQTIREGDKVRCKRGSIDRDVGAGEVGYVTGFARFSKYHGREVRVQSAPSHIDSKWSGWFWLSDVEPIQ